MKLENKNLIGIEIDNLTNSILNIITGESFRTEIQLISKEDLKKITKKNGWLFDWKSEYNAKERNLFKLTILNNPEIIQGLVSISDAEDHFYLHLIESAPFNLGKNKIFVGVPGNLFAFTCKMSWDKGYQGFVAFTSKTKLIEHYEKMLGAVNVAGQRMVIFPEEALKLIKRYFQV